MCPAAAPFWLTLTSFPDKPGAGGHKWTSVAELQEEEGLVMNVGTEQRGYPESPGLELPQAWVSCRELGAAHVREVQEWVERNHRCSQVHRWRLEGANRSEVGEVYPMAEDLALQRGLETGRGG